ncbi:MAG: DUF2934 domain-containing protein [Planctomycetota bacterium]
MVGSNAAALKQHAYSVFTASRRDHTGTNRVPDSVLRPMSPTTPSPPSVLMKAGAGAARPVQFAEPKKPAAAAKQLLDQGLAKHESRPSADPLHPQPHPASAWGGVPTHDEIRARAYERYLARKDQPSDPVGDWLAAEAELKRERGLD